MESEKPKTTGQNHLIKNQALQNSNKNENEQYFTMSWGHVQQVPTQSLSQAQTKYHNLSSQVNVRTLHMSSFQEQDRHSQLIGLNSIVQKKQRINFAPLMKPSQYFPSYSKPQKLFNQMPFTQENLSQRKANQNQNRTNPTDFPNQNSPKRTEFFLKELKYHRSKSNSQELEKQVNQNMNLQLLPNQSPQTLQQQQQNMNEKQSQESIRLNIRSQLIRRSRKNEISTNNAHKKYINCLRNLFYEALSKEQIQDFEKKYNGKKIYVKYRFSESLARAVREGFENQMKQRIREYEDQVYRSSDPSIKNFRIQEIRQIQIALRAIGEFYDGNTAQAIDHLYRKGKQIIMKTEYAALVEPKISKPYNKNIYPKKISQPPVDFDREFYLRYANEKEDNPSDEMVVGKQGEISSALKKPFNGIVQNENTQKGLEVQDEKQHYQQDSLKNNSNRAQNLQILQHQLASQQHPQFFINYEPASNEGSELSERYLRPLKNIDEPPGFLKQNFYNRYRQEYQREQQALEDILFPPIPPHFYLPDFDQKYGHLFRKLVYVKTWNQIDEDRRQIQLFSERHRHKQSMRGAVPSPLVFGNDSSPFVRRF